MSNRHKKNFKLNFSICNPNQKKIEVTYNLHDNCVDLDPKKKLAGEKN